MTPSELVAEAKAVTRFGKTEKWIEQIWFFGSRVWGTPRADSDLDILIVTPPGYSSGEIQRWTSKLEGASRFKIHIFDSFHMPDDILDRIELAGVKAYDVTGNSKIERYEALEID